jgi:transcription initiation factor TFIID subunit 9B
MASPAAPLTPPAEPSSSLPASTQTQTQTQTQSQTQTLTQGSTQAQGSTQSSGPSGSTRVEALLAQPLTSLTDDGTSKRPRDHRLIHLLLASQGVNAYQERVPLQLMDFAYRYTSTILSDALHIQQEGYNDTEHATNSKKGSKSSASKNEEGDVSLTALRMSIASRVAHQFTGQANLPKEFLKGLADERNRISLLQQAKDEKSAGINIGGVKLPHERHLMTGTGWGLKNEWESEGEESDEDDEIKAPPAGESGDARMDDADEDEGMEDDEGMGTMEDVFGADDDAGKDDDAEMKDS